ncbi:nuclear transport factor 2 family protein [Streptomyces sp. NPDC088354]|uniref:nuclear transport factor 2 family protein n=1 Tax=unclassified Streptomyces TaxID=2593676 RepID=UPI0029AA1715|nr:nuclear transport factor 2 family protein [Streptomyces sp. MI02-7b]MDX3072099.1 nuclear transport factor 2 family protein [Streptomyces sp. MI02-7b]
MADDNAGIIADFLALFADKDAAKLAPYLHPEVVFQNYGDPEIRGRENLLAMWAGVFGSFERVEFTTLHSAVNGDLVIEEQIHGLALPGRQLAPIRNMAVYRLEDGRIVEWRDCTNPEHARSLL